MQKHNMQKHKMKFKNQLILVAFILCTACLSPREVFEYNTNISKLDDNYYRITSGHKSVLNYHEIEDYLLLAAAETTINNGKTHFIIKDSVTDKKETIHRVDGYSTQDCKKNQDNTHKTCREHYTPAYVDKKTSSIRSIYIKTYHKKDIPNTNKKVYEAIKVRTNLGSRLLRDQ